jgi:hypothetical protein
MKSVIFILIGLSVATFFIQAQNNTTSPWAVRAFKHEVSLDVSPAVKWAVARAEAPESVGFTYRYFFKNKHGFRLGYRSAFDNYHNNQGSQEYIGYKKTPDSIQVISVLKYESTRNSMHTIRPGYEYRLGNRRVKGIFGIDLISGIQVNNNNVTYDYHYSATHHINTSAQYTMSLGGIDTTVFNWGVSRHTVSYVVGFAPVIGLHINLSSRWSLTSSMFYDFYWNIPFKTDINGLRISNNSIRGFNIGLESPVADVSLTFSFGKGKKRPAND